MRAGKVEIGGVKADRMKSDETEAGQTEAAALLEQAIAYVHSNGKAPDRRATVDVLLAEEKSARARRQPIELSQLTGDWRLTFITGTKKSRQRAGVALGAGRFLPSWIKIAIAYRAAKSESATAPTNTDPETGTVENRVRFAGVDLTVTGPIQLYPSRRVLAFDFIKVRFALSGIQLFDGYVKGGAAREQAFAQKSLRDQAFFTYFWVTQDLIAARGRGGGLAIWVREH